MSISETIIRHYNKNERAEQVLKQANAAASLSQDDINPYDQMHVGGHHATAAFFQRLPIKADQHILDIGSGLGGPARYLASRYRARVSGIDLTASLCEQASFLAEKTKLSNNVKFQAGDATALPFEAQHFDMAYTIHVAMNIHDRDSLYSEAFRVLKPGSLFGLYDVMLTDKNSTLEFPMPWSNVSDGSHLITKEQTQKNLEHAGFKIIEGHDYTNEGLQHLRAARDKTEKDGKQEPQKFLNLEKALGENILRAHMIIAQKP